jgi:hypothetical protein
MQHAQIQKLFELSQRMVNCVEEFYSRNSAVAASGIIDPQKLLMVSDVLKSFLLDDPNFAAQEAMLDLAEVETLAYDAEESPFPDMPEAHDNGQDNGQDNSQDTDLDADLDAALDSNLIVASVYTLVPASSTVKHGPKKMPKHIAEIVLKDAMETKKTCPITDALISMDSTVTECGHIFETEAYDKWMTKSTKCPMCKFEG